MRMIFVNFVTNLKPMLHKTKGIVLHILPYNDKFLIVTVYTEAFGRMAYLIANVRSKKTKVSRSVIQPLALLELEVEHQNTRDIQRIKEAKSGLIMTQLRYHPVKNAITLFLSEVLYRIIQEKEANQALFDFLCRSLKLFEIAEAGVANFHLTFLLQLSAYLGIRPSNKSFKPDTYFDLLNGVFSETIPAHTNFLSKNDSLVFERLMRMNYENMALYTFTRHERTAIVRHILDYYRLHLADFPEIKSLAVMQSLFD